MYWWARQYPVGDMAKEVQIDKGIACDMYEWFRGVIYLKKYKVQAIILTISIGVLHKIDADKYFAWRSWGGGSN